MHDIISRLSEEAILGICGMMVGVVFLLGCTAVAMTKVMSSHYRKSQLNEMEATLKMEMIQRGMPASEIKQVLEARMASSRPQWSEILAGISPLNVPGAMAKHYKKA